MVIEEGFTSLLCRWELLSFISFLVITPFLGALEEGSGTFVNLLDEEGKAAGGAGLLHRFVPKGELAFRLAVAGVKHFAVT